PPPPPSSTLFPYTTLFRSHGLMACETIPTLAARNVVGHEHAVADLDTVHTRADLDDFRGDLVAEDERRLRLAVPLHHIGAADSRSEEHTSELQSRFDLVCR